MAEVKATRSDRFYVFQAGQLPPGENSASKERVTDEWDPLNRPINIRSKVYNIALGAGLFLGAAAVIFAASHCGVFAKMGALAHLSTTMPHLLHVSQTAYHAIQIATIAGGSTVIAGCTVRILLDIQRAHLLTVDLDKVSDLKS